MKQKKVLISAAFIMLLTMSSCVTRSYEVYTPPPSPAPNATRTLSTRYGIQVTPRDNYALYNTVAQWLGTRYRRGGNTMRGTDCSGFAINIYRSVYGKNLARNSADMLRLNCRSIPMQSLREGNLVFFATNRNSRKVSHVGVYLKDGKFAHASTSQGVIISNLNEPYYRQRWVSGGVVR
jgi:cell wall-associated NlpC family hydrolase